MRPHVRIFVADDQPDFVELLSEHLASYEQFEIVGSATTTESALESVRQTPVDVLLLDVVMPRMNGLEAVKHFQESTPDTRIVMLTSLPPVDAELQAIKAGADGYVCKQGTFAQFAGDVIQAVELVNRGKLFFDLSAWRRLNRTSPPPLPTVSPLPTKLSGREQEVLLLIAEGLTSREIATRLGLSKRTVDKHRQRLTHRLQIRGTANLTKFALDAGLYRAYRAADQD